MDFASGCERERDVKFSAVAGARAAVS